MEAIGLNIADWFIIIVLTASGLISLARGFTKEFLSLFLWLIAFIAAVSLEYLATPKINEYIGNEEISRPNASQRRRIENPRRSAQLGGKFRNKRASAGASALFLSLSFSAARKGVRYRRALIRHKSAARDCTVRHAA